MGGSPAESERDDEELSQVSREDPIVSSSWDLGGASHTCEIEETHSARSYAAYYAPSTRSSVFEDSNNYQTEVDLDNAIPLKDMISSLFGTNMDVVKDLPKNPQLHRTINLCASLPGLLSCAQKLDTILQSVVRPYTIYPQKLDTFREEGKQLRLKLFVFNESLILQQRMMMANMQPGDRKFHSNKLRIRKDEVAAGPEREAYDAFNNLVVIRLLVSRMLSKIQALLAAAESYYSGDNNWKRVANVITREATGFTSCIEELEGQSLQWRESVQREVTVALEEIAGQASVNSE